MSARLAIWRVGLDRRMVPRWTQAGAPRVLPPKRISVTVSDARSGARWGVISSAESSLREEVERMKMLGSEAIVTVEFVAMGMGFFLLCGFMCDCACDFLWSLCIALVVQPYE